MPLAKENPATNFNQQSTLRACVYVQIYQIYTNASMGTIQMLWMASVRHGCVHITLSLTLLRFECVHFDFTIFNFVHSCRTFWINSFFKLQSLVWDTQLLFAVDSDRALTDVSILPIHFYSIELSWEFN